MKIKQQFFDRCYQSFGILKNNFLVLIIPILVYSTTSIVIFYLLIWNYFLSKIWNINFETFNLISFFSNPNIILFIIICIILLTIYALFYLVIFLSLIKTIKDIINEEKNISIYKNFKYWLEVFFKSMKIYWYIFVYVALIPAILFIIWWIIFIYWYKVIWIITITISLILFIIYMIYRWTKTSFSIFKAIEVNNFNKKLFLESVNITNNKWWRIFWNLFFIWIIISIIISLINWLFSNIIFWLSWWSNDILPIIKLYLSNNNIDDIKNIFLSYIENKSFFSNLILSAIYSITDTIWIVFITIFSYLFFLRIGREINFKENRNQEKENIEL